MNKSKQQQKYYNQSINSGDIYHAIFGVISASYTFIIPVFLFYQIYGYITKKDDVIRDIGVFVLCHYLAIYFNFIF